MLHVDLFDQGMEHSKFSHFDSFYFILQDFKLKFEIQIIRKIFNEF